MDSYQIWPCHVTQAKNWSFLYLKSYCPLNFRKSHQISGFCCIPNGNYKEDNLKEGRICSLPPPSPTQCGIGLNSSSCVSGCLKICLNYRFHGLKAMDFVLDNIKSGYMLRFHHTPDSRCSEKQQVSNQAQVIR